MKIIIQDLGSQEFILTEVKIKNIYRNLFYLQKKIYLASRECNLSLVHSLQKLLISSLSINTLAKHLAARKYSKIVSNSEQCKDSKVLKCQISKLISYWCLEAEWRQKLASKTNSIPISHLYCDKYCQFIPSYNWSIKHTDIKYLTVRLQTTRWLERNIRNLYYKQMLNSNMRWIPDPGLYNYIDADPLAYLLNTILQNDLYWLYYQQNLKCFTSIKRKNQLSKYRESVLEKSKLFKDAKGIIYKFIYNTSLLKNNSYASQYLSSQDSTRHSNVIKERLFIYLKHLLYHKDQSGRLRINHHKTFDIVFKIFFDKAKQWKQMYGYLFNQKCISEINNLISIIFRKWLKKRFPKNAELKNLIKYPMKLL
uniref:hypothetical protein n=1 Tax=Nemalion vermiculare TaxID=935621 RepID=UPI002580FB5E|nr:hypothetical protein QU266_pgp122 [Nemalion vermiculare]WGV34333.1 hypothetical protein [Nemalion vermiculare]